MPDSIVHVGHGVFGGTPIEKISIPKSFLDGESVEYLMSMMRIDDKCEVEVRGNE